MKIGDPRVSPDESSRAPSGDDEVIVVELTPELAASLDVSEAGTSDHLTREAVALSLLLRGLALAEGTSS